MPRKRGVGRPNPYYDAATDLWCYDTSRTIDAETAKTTAEANRYERDAIEQYHRWGTSE